MAKSRSYGVVIIRPGKAGIICARDYTKWSTVRNNSWCPDPLS